MVRRSRRIRRGIAIAIAAVAVLVIAARIALTPFLESKVRDALRHMHGMRGTFSTMDLSVVHLSWALHDLDVEKLSPEGHRTPYVRAARIQIGLYWKELLRGHLVGAAELDRPKLSLVSAKEPQNEQKVGEAPELGKKLQQITPFRLDRVEVRDGELLWIDAHAPERPKLWLHGIEATLENFATRAAMARGEPSVLAASATLQRSGKVSIFASADPLAKGLTFAGQARLRGLQLTELGALLAATQGVTPTRGTLDINAAFRSVDGHVTGGVRPVLKNADVQQAKPGLGARLKSFLADITIKVLSDRVPGRNAVATTIPLEGDVQDANAQLWPTVLGVIRNAFVAGLADSLTNLPPKRGGAQDQGGDRAQARRGSASDRQERR